MGHGLKSQNFFPAIGANGPATVHVNLGQNGFNFIEANVKKWGLAPVTGSLAPPPPYGSEQGSILLESGAKTGYPQYQRAHANTHSGVHPYRSNASQNLNAQHGRSRSGTFRVMPPASPGPQRSPTDISLAQLVPTEEGEEQPSTGAVAHDDEPHETVGLGMQDALNPPPDYTSPENSESGSRRASLDSENTPLIQIVDRNRQSSSATGSPSGSGAGSSGSPGSSASVSASVSTSGSGSASGTNHPPIPTYSDAVGENSEDGTPRSPSPGAMV